MEEYYKYDDWADVYKPLLDKNGYEIHFETYGEHLEKLEETLKQLAKDNNTKPYQHAWTRKDDGEGRLIIVNGFRRVNRMDFQVTKEPWGTGEEEDKDIYIQVEYDNE